LTRLHVGKNNIPAKEMKEIMAIAMHMDSMKILCEIPFKDKTLTELDVSGKNLGMEGALVVAEYLDGNGALTSLHVGQNGIPEKEMREIMAIAMRMDMDIMKILCEIPFKDKTLTELDVSGKDLGAEGALVVAEYLDGNGALTSLDISNQVDKYGDGGLSAEGAKYLAGALKDHA
jgi:Ran GTPase-activating protein (RanGAP) involved in mRNA processing and transport